MSKLCSPAGLRLLKAGTAGTHRQCTGFPLSLALEGLVLRSVTMADCKIALPSGASWDKMLLNSEPTGESLCSLAWMLATVGSPWAICHSQVFCRSIIYLCWEHVLQGIIKVLLGRQATNPSGCIAWALCKPVLNQGRTVFWILKGLTSLQKMVKVTFSFGYLIKTPLLVIVFSGTIILTFR